MVLFNKSIKNISGDIKTLSDYAVIKSHEGKDAQGRVFLTLLGDHLEITTDKTIQASERQIHDYVVKLRKTIEYDQKLMAIPEEKTALQKRLSDAFSKFKEAIETDFDLLLGDFKTEIKSFIVSIKEDNPFYGMDLIVLKNEYEGVIPLNGIREDEFNEMTDRIEELREEDSIGGLVLEMDEEDFNSEEEAEYFKNEIIKGITKLSTRRVGRDLINALIDQKKGIGIVSMDIEGSPLFDRVSLSICVNLDYFVLLPTLKEKSDRELTPFFIVLGHEMAHALNYVNDKESMIVRTQTHIPKIDNLEEQLAILGWGEEDYKPPRDQKLSDKMEQSDDWDKVLDEHSQPVEPNTYFSWEEMSENGLRSVFDISPRAADHSGETIAKSDLEFRKAAFISSIPYESLENLSNSFTPSFVQFMAVLSGGDDFLNEAMEKACEHGRWDVAALLKKKGGATISFDRWENTLDRELIYALIEDNKKRIDHLLELGADSSFKILSLDAMKAKLKQTFIKELIKTPDIDFYEWMQFIENNDVLSGSERMEFLNEAVDQLSELKKWTLVANLIDEGVPMNTFLNRWKSILDKELIVEVKNKNSAAIYELIALGANPAILLSLEDDPLNDLALERDLLNNAEEMYQERTEEEDDE